MGQFMISLAHFCEIHGPTMVMCTQSVPTRTFEMLVDKENSLDIPKSQLCRSCSLIIPAKKTPTSPSLDNAKKDMGSEDNEGANEQSQRSSSGNDLQSLTRDMSLTQLINDEVPTFIESKDKDKSTSYVSTQYPSSQARYSILRHMIMRSLSMESNYDSSKPMIFGDQHNGYTIALIFKLHDSMARGSERKYCILIAAESELELLENWTLIMENFSGIVEYIKNRCSQVEVDRLKSQSNKGAMNINSERYFRRSTVVPKPKSLVELLDDEQFFMKLHLWASQLLLSLN